MADARAAPDAGKPKLAYIGARVDPELQQAVKVTAARKRMSVQDVITELLTQWVEQEAQDK